MDTEFRVRKKSTNLKAARHSPSSFQGKYLDRRLGEDWDRNGNGNGQRATVLRITLLQCRGKNNPRNNNRFVARKFIASCRRTLNLGDCRRNGNIPTRCNATFYAGKNTLGSDAQPPPRRCLSLSPPVAAFIRRLSGILLEVEKPRRIRENRDTFHRKTIYFSE